MCSAYSIFAIDSVFGTEHSLFAILKKDHNSWKTWFPDDSFFLALYDIGKFSIFGRCLYISYLWLFGFLVYDSK